MPEGVKARVDSKISASSRQRSGHSQRVPRLQPRRPWTSLVGVALKDSAAHLRRYCRQTHTCSDQAIYDAGIRDCIPSAAQNLSQRFLKRCPAVEVVKRMGECDTSESGYRRCRIDSVGVPIVCDKLNACDEPSSGQLETYKGLS